MSMADQAAAVRTACLTEDRQASKTSAWSTAKGTRTFAELRQRGEELAAEARVQQKRGREQDRKKRLADMARSPK